MLPKVANHVLHTTARAVGAQQQALRNVLQSSGSGSGSHVVSWGTVGSSGYGNAGAGAGGAKYHAGSQAYGGYTGAGRAVTQANGSGADSNNTGDDTDELAVHRAHFRAGPSSASTRGRSRSISHRLEIRAGAQSSVLKAVQAHARAKHAFASARQADQADEPALVRHNSSVSLVSDGAADMAPPPPPEALEMLKDEVDAAASEEPPRSASPPPPGAPSALTQPIFVALQHTQKNSTVPEAVKEFRKASNGSTSADWNYALTALCTARLPGQTLTNLLETYNDMVTNGIVPTFDTYRILIHALCEREEELVRARQILDAKMSDRSRSGLEVSTLEIAKLTKLGQEDHFDSILTLFQALAALHADKIAPETYEALLDLCGRRGKAEAAMHVFSNWEKRPDLKPSAAAYAHLLTAYTAEKDLAGAKEIFAEFRAASAEGTITWAREDEVVEGSYDELADAARPGIARARQLEVWHHAIQACIRLDDAPGGLALLEEMLDSPAPTLFGPTDVPLPAPSTYSSLISAFCAAGDVESAQAWLSKLRAQKEPAGPHYLGSKEPRRPDRLAWLTVLRALERTWNIREFNATFEAFEAQTEADGRKIWTADRAFLARANAVAIRHMDDMPAAEALGAFALVERVLFVTPGLNEPVVVNTRAITRVAVMVFLRYGAREEAARFVEKWAEYDVAVIRNRVNAHWAAERNLFRNSLSEMVRQIMETPGPLSAQHALDLAALVTKSRAGAFDRLTAGHVLDFYEQADKDSLSIDGLRWNTLLALSVAAEGRMLEAILADALRAGVNVEKMDVKLVINIATVLSRTRGAEGAADYFKTLGATAESVFAPHVSAPEPLSEPSSPASSVTAVDTVRIDLTHSAAVNEHFPANPSVKPVQCYERFASGLKEGLYPTIEHTGNLIRALGRERRADLVRSVYAAAQALLQTGPANGYKARLQVLEDAMINALVVAEEGEHAHVHREALLAAGCVPSADSYGALVLALSNTTDDAAAALAIFQEARDHGVRPTPFLFNNVISKLAKARRVDAALELFEEMKRTRVRPTSVTYGAVIGACARVGDAHSAELLFAEMASQPSFRPRVPPYNTMIQLYVQTKPDRSRALAYYHAMRQANVQPSEHTYKLLIDAYGTIEPLDLRAMEDVFQSLVADPRVQVSGVHWAALINAYGCAAKDLDRALAVFESIAMHPSAARAREPLPDALTFEALVGALVANKRTDLLSAYAAKIVDSGVHVTAYVNNALIRGFAAAGDLDTARAMFEEMADPPVGVAAPNNHAPHAGARLEQVAPDAPVYREPSTWEAMVRAELGAGQRERAVELLKRLRERHYPQAVYNRISGIMLDDDSVSPWPTPTTMTDSAAAPTSP